MKNRDIPLLPFTSRNLSEGEFSSMTAVSLLIFAAGCLGLLFHDEIPVHWYNLGVLLCVTLLYIPGGGVVERFSNQPGDPVTIITRNTVAVISFVAALGAHLYMLYVGEVVPVGAIAFTPIGTFDSWARIFDSWAPLVFLSGVVYLGLVALLLNWVSFFLFVRGNYIHSKGGNGGDGGGSRKRGGYPMKRSLSRLFARFRPRTSPASDTDAPVPESGRGVDRETGTGVDKAGKAPDKGVDAAHIHPEPFHTHPQHQRLQ